MKKTLALCISLLVLHSTGFGNVYTYDSSVENWFSNGLTATHHGVLILSQDNTGGTYPDTFNMVFAQAIGLKTTYPTANPRDFAGAVWTAPANEVIVSFTVSGSYRSDDPLDFGAAVYGGTSSEATASTLLTENEPITRNDGNKRDSYEWTITIDPNAGITHLQFNAWMALKTVGTNGDGDPWGYSGIIDRIEITTQAIPEASTAGLGIVGALALLSVWKFLPTTKVHKEG